MPTPRFRPAAAPGGRHSALLFCLQKATAGFFPRICRVKSEMAPTRLSRLLPLALAALCIGAAARSHGQSRSVEPGSLSGKLTDLHSAPLGGVSVVLRNVVTGLQMRTTTASNGAYRFSSLDAGEYTMDAESAQLGSGHLEGLVVAAGHEARVQTAMRLELRSAALVAGSAVPRASMASVRSVRVAEPAMFSAPQAENPPATLQLERPPTESLRLRPMQSAAPIRVSASPPAQLASIEIAGDRKSVV